MARKKCKGTELSVFKGREARLNRAIFQTLALQGPQTIYGIHKNVKVIKGLKHVHYANANRRVRALEQLGYLKVAKIKNTKAGFESSVYELSSRAYLTVLLDSISLEKIISEIDEESASQILVAIVAELQLLGKNNIAH